MKKVQLYALTILPLLLVTCNGETIKPNEEIITSLKPENNFDFPTVDCSSCTHIVSEYQTDGEALNIQPGDVICLDASVAYDRLLFSKIVGTADNPVIIRNCGGVAVITSTGAGGVSFEESKYFKILGDGGGGNYGIKISTSNGFFLYFRTFTTNFEVGHVEIAGNSDGFAGIGVKTSPYEDCAYFEDPSRPWLMEDIVIRNSYIHDVGGEGLYIGHGFHAGWTGRECTSTTYPHLIRGLHIYSNVIENTGYDGMQIKNCDQDVEIYNNYIYNYGVKAENGQNEGVLWGDIATGNFYNNVVIKGTGNGLRMLSVGGNNFVYNNIIMDSQRNGIRVDGGNDFDMLTTDAFLYFMNNNIINSGEDGFVIFDSRNAERRFYNNVILNAVGKLYNIGSQVDNVDSAAVFLSNDVSDFQFLDIANFDFELQGTSPGVDAGIDASTYGVTKDILGRNRPVGDAFDIGAFEQ